MTKPLDNWLDHYYQQRPQLDAPPKDVFGEYSMDHRVRPPFQKLIDDHNVLREKLAEAKAAAQASRWRLPPWLRRWLNGFYSQGLPRFRYGGTDTFARLKGCMVHGVGQSPDLRLMNAFYDRRLGCYMYWAEFNGAYAIIPEPYLY